MLLKGTNLNSETSISISKAGIGELHVVILLADHVITILAVADFSLKVKSNGLEFLASESFSLALSQLSNAFFVTTVEVALSDSVIGGKSSCLILEHSKVSLRALEDLSGSSEIEFSLLGNLGHIVSSVMGLCQLVVSSSDLLTGGIVFALSVSVQLSESLNLILVLNLLLLQLGDFEQQVVDVLSDLVAGVGLVSHVSLETGYVDLLSSNLVAGCAQVLLNVANDAGLFVQEEAEIVHLFLETDDGDLVRVVLQTEVVVLEELLVLEVTVLGLNGVQLVSQGEEVLVALLNFENLGLKLRDEKVLLVGGEVHTVVVL